MPMRPIAKWHAREQDRGEFQSTRIGKPGGFFGRFDRFCFDHGVLARMALARLAVPRAGGGADCLLRAGSLRQRGRYLAAKSASAGGAGAPGDFDFYVLALSWSSGFCETPAAARARQVIPAPISASSCMGFGPNMSMAFRRIVDWPPGLSRTLESARGSIPAKGLPGMNGKSTAPLGKSPTDYFRRCAARPRFIVIPAPFVAAKEKQTWTPIDIARAFIAANARLRPGMLGVACTGSVLQEVRICFSKDLRAFHACPEVSRQGCRVRGVSVPPVL